MSKHKNKEKSKSKSAKRTKSDRNFCLSHNSDDIKLIDMPENFKMKQKVKRKGRTKEHASGEKSRSRKGAKGAIKSIRRRPRPLMTRLVAELATKEQSMYRTRYQITDECIHRPLALEYDWIGPEVEFAMSKPRIRRTPSDDSLVGKSFVYPGDQEPCKKVKPLAKSSISASKTSEQGSEPELPPDPTLDSILIEFHRLTVGDSRIFQVQ